MIFFSSIANLTEKESFASSSRKFKGVNSWKLSQKVSIKEQNKIEFLSDRINKSI